MIVNLRGLHSVSFMLDFNRRRKSIRGFLSLLWKQVSVCTLELCSVFVDHERTQRLPGWVPRNSCTLVPAGARTEPQGGTVQEQWRHYESNGQGLGLTTRPHCLRARRARNSATAPWDCIPKWQPLREPGRAHSKPSSQQQARPTTQPVWGESAEKHIPFLLT